MYSGSQTSSKDMNLLFQSSTFKNSSEGGGEFQRNNSNRGEVSMDVNLFHRRHHHQNQHPQQNQQNQQQLNSGLMRYRSAPSSLLANLITGDDEGEGCDTFIPPHSSPEAETIFARFMSTCAGNDSCSPDLIEIGDKSTAINIRNPQFMAAMEQESEENGFPPAPQMVFHSPPPQQPPPPPQNSVQNQSSNPTENSYRVVNSMAMDQHHPSQLKMAGSGNTTNSSNLIRHSSSPAGLFSHLSVENGYAVMRGIGNFSAGNGTNGDATPSNSRLKSQLSFPSRPPSSSGLMSQISEIESDSIEGGNSGEEGSLGNSNNRFIPGFSQASWDDSGLENFTGIKRARDINHKMISGLNPSETRNGEAGHHTTPGLTHHYSLPTNSAEMAAILQFQDSVPCKIRAKRGCATHPRSIAERVRRTRISERMRKLQELVPNMDKQTNTSDMLDLAVEYIKDLQKQVKTFNENRANCTCSSKQKP